MKNKKLFNLSAIILGIMTLFSFNKVQAREMTSVFGMPLTRDNLSSLTTSNVFTTKDSETLKLIDSGYKYNGSNKVWKIINEDKLKNVYYCLNMTRGFSGMAENSTDEYTYKQELTKSDLDKYSGVTLSDETYNKILWILDNAYVPTDTENIYENDSYKLLMKNAGIDIYSDNTYNLTIDDITIAQRLAIWHYTNDFKAASSIEGLPDQDLKGKYEEVITKSRKAKLVELYNYFVNNAEASYIRQVPNIELVKSDVYIQEDDTSYIVGPYYLKGQNISAIKAINAISDKDYTLLDSEKNQVKNNDFSKVIDKEFYLKFNKNEITQSTNFEINIEYTYDEKTAIFMTNISEVSSTQPVVIIESVNVAANTIIEVPIILTNISVEKIWEDNNDQDGLRPTSVQVQLYKDGTEYGTSVTLSELNNLTYTWTKLLAGHEYAVKELNSTGNIVSDGAKYNSNYTAKYEVYDKKIIITNIHIPETIEISGTKTWEDNNNQDGIRPETITVNLLANGEKVDSKTVIYPWTYSFTQLPKYEAGKEITYTITEDIVEGYTTTIDGYNITNKYTPNKTSKTVVKKWQDENNSDGIRPEEILVELYKMENGEEVSVDTKKLNASNNWTYTWTDLDKKINGVDIVYGIKEITDIEGYTTTYSEENYENVNTITITNTHEIEKTNEYSVRLLKVGEDGTTSLSGAWFKINEGQATLISENGTKLANGTISEAGDLQLEYKLEEVTAPEGYIKLAEPKVVKINAKVEFKEEKYQITQVSMQEEIDGIAISEENNVITIKVKNEEEITGKYNVVLRKVDENGNILTGAKFKVSGKEYDLSTGETILFSNQQITSNEDINFTYIIEETLVPSGYNGIETVEVNIKAQVEKNENIYKLVRATLVDSEGNNITDENISIKLEDNSIVIIVKNTPIEKEFDLSLRKFITEINGESYLREPVVDTSTIATNGTATYKHTKQPIAVQKGDIVTYTIRVYNEGEIDGYVDMITDHLPENLKPIIDGIEGIDTEKYADEIEFNSNWLWIYSEDEKTVTTTITSKYNTDSYSILTGREDVIDTKLNSYVDDSDNLDYIDVQIKCLVSDNAVSGEYLTNIAEISKMCDIDGTEIEIDRDSTKANVHYANLAEYKNEEAINSSTNSYIVGQEDDDDFEKIFVKEFDLSLRKFVIKVNETSYSREPVVDTSKLGIQGITTATYIHSKKTVIVETGDIVTYKIRIYNEGTLDGFANEITDNIPEGLEYLPNSSVNVSYKWKMIDSEGKETNDVTEAVIITTDYLSNRDKNNVINAVSEIDGVKILNYKDVEVQFKVTATAQNLKDNIIINEAQISEDSDRDIDSIPNRDEKYDYETWNNEDDIDYEPIKLQYFDLALRKFITKVNNTDYNNRYPEIIYKEDGSITYNHTKDPVLVTTGDTVTYTIRVYNEGEKAGYATEIKDNLPDGLAFEPENETNKLYGWKMLDSEGNETKDASKVTQFSTDYLKNELIAALVEENGSKILSYKDVQIAFKVVESNTSDRILVNTAEILKDSDDDIDSIPNNNIETEDDLDKEYVKVQYFDLALKKWVTSTKVTYNGKTTTTKTGFTEDSEGIAKVDLVASKMKKTIVKFIYNIKVINEGELAGYAYEVKDYIPKGLKFIQEDNKDWKEIEDGVVVTDKLKDTLLNPGESATLEITLTWKNSTTNLGLKTNYAEISEDSAEDIDSIPDNFDFTEDDMDDAQVILSIKTAAATTYVGLILISTAILATGIFLIKKYVIN